MASEVQEGEGAVNAPCYKHRWEEPNKYNVLLCKTPECSCWAFKRAREGFVEYGGKLPEGVKQMILDLRQGIWAKGLDL